MKIKVPFLTFFLLLSFALKSQEPTFSDSIIYSFGLKLDEAFYDEDSDFFLKHFDSKSFYNKFLIEEKNEDIKNFNEGFSQKNIGVAFHKQIAGHLKLGTLYNFVNYYQLEDTYHLIFRLYDDGSINYHEYVVDFDSDKQPKISDIFIYLTGQFLSETMAANYYPFVQKYIEDTSEGFDKRLLLDYVLIKKINELRLKGKVEAAKKLYNTGISEDFKNSSIGLGYATQFIDPETEPLEYTILMEKILENSSSPASVYLVYIDYHFMSGDYDKALSAIDSIGRYTGDEFLDLYRGNIHVMMEDYEESAKYFEKMIENYPQFSDTYDSLLALYIQMNQPNRITTLLDRCAENLSIEKKDLVSVLESDFPAALDFAEVKKWAKTN